MWDKPDQLRMVSGTLFGISFVLALYGALHYVLQLPVFPLRAVQLSTAPRHVDTAQIETVVRDEVRGNFFSVDLDGARHAFEKLPWVRKVSVRRFFPWRLEVNLEEHVALASWNGVELVNSHGEVFLAQRGLALPELSGGLPQFIGKPGTAAEVAQMYAAFGELLAPLRQEIVQISLSPRHAWQLRLSGGMVLELGREQPQQRLARFVAVQNTGGGSRAEGGGRMYVDLRYRNGFAVRKQGMEDRNRRVDRGAVG